MSIAIPDRKEPITLGHEGAGYIEAIHPSAENKGFAAGDAIGFLYIQGACFECRGCLVHNNHCLTRQSNVNGFTIPGFFAEYAVVDYQSCIKLPEKMEMVTASPMFCAGITGKSPRPPKSPSTADARQRIAFHCIDSCELQPQDWLVIVGCGGLGQMAIQYAKAMQARVIAVDISDEILANAKAQGADLVFNSRSGKTCQDEILQLTGGGAHAVAVFSNADAAYASATPLIRIGGILMVVGLPANGVRLDALDVARGTYRVKGDSTSTPQRMPKAIEFTVKHGIKPQVEIYPSLDNVPEMVKSMQDGLSTKRMVVSLG